MKNREKNLIVIALPKSRQNEQKSRNSATQTQPVENINKNSKKHINQLTKWLAILSLVIALAQTIVFAANPVTIEPGKDVQGPPRCPQIEVSASDDSKVENNIGSYSIILIERGIPLTDKNFIPSNSPSSIDSYFPPSGQQVSVHNLGEIPIEVNFVCD